MLESPLDCTEIKPVNSEGNQSWVFIRRNDAEAETPILWLPDTESWLIRKDPDAGVRVKAEGEGDDRGWDGRMALLTQWTWVWASSRRWWRTGKPGVLQSVGSQRAGHDWTTTRSQYFLSGHLSQVLIPWRTHKLYIVYLKKSVQGERIHPLCDDYAEQILR